MPWVASCHLLIGSFAQQFVKAASQYADQPVLVSCFRCGVQEELATPDTPAKFAKVS